MGKAGQHPTHQTFHFPNPSLHNQEVLSYIFGVGSCTCMRWIGHTYQTVGSDTLADPSFYNQEVLYWAPLAGGRQGLCISNRRCLQNYDTFQSVLVRHHFPPNKSKPKRYRGVNLQNISMLCFMFCGVPSPNTGRAGADVSKSYFAWGNWLGRLPAPNTQYISFSLSSVLQCRLQMYRSDATTPCGQRPIWRIQLIDPFLGARLVTAPPLNNQTEFIAAFFRS